MSEQHRIKVERYETAVELVDRVWPEYSWTCTCGESDIVDDRSGEKVWRAGEKHLVDAHGQEPETAR